jgi:hypothetical protein
MRAPRPPRLPRKSQSPYSPRSFGFVSSFGCVWRVLFSLRRATSRRCRIEALRESPSPSLKGHFSAMPRSGFAFALRRLLSPPRLPLRGGVRMARRSLLFLATSVPFGRGCLMRGPRPPKLHPKSQSPYFPRSFGFVSSFGFVRRVLFSLRSDFSAMPNPIAARRPFAEPQGHFSAMPRSGFAFALRRLLSPPRLLLRGGVRMARRSLLFLATGVPSGRGCLMRAPRPPRLRRKSQSPYFPRSFGFVSSFGFVRRVLFPIRRATSRRCRNRSAARRPFAKPQGPLLGDAEKWVCFCISSSQAFLSRSPSRSPSVIKYGSTSPARLRRRLVTKRIPLRAL